MVGQKFRHASTMGQGDLGQSWRNLRTRVRRKHHHVRLIVHLNIDRPLDQGRLIVTQKKDQKSELTGCP